MDDQGTSVAGSTSGVAVSALGHPAPRPAKPGRFPLLGVVVIVLGLVAGAVGYYFFANRDGKATGAEPKVNQEASADQQASASSNLPVEAVHPHQGGIERTTTQAGSVHSFYHATLYAKVSGYLKEQSVDIGASVKVGQLLAVIDDPEVDQTVQQNKAALDQALAKVHVAESKIRSAQAAKEASEAMVKVSESMVASKTFNEELQKKQLVRVAGLVRQSAVEAKLEDEQQDRADVATADVGVARSEVLSARADVMNKGALVEAAQADLLEARANVEVARANLAKAQVFQEYTRIRSPYDGVVTVRNFHPGDFIRSASEGGNLPVLAVAVTNKMRVVMPIPDVDVPFVDVGDKATFQIVALPGKSFTGSVSRFSFTEDPESRNMRTEIDLPNDGTLREGMYGRVTVVLQAAALNSLTIPSSGLLGQSGKGEGSVYVVRDGKAHKVDVQVGNDNGVETEILKGLTTADQVITTYNGSLEEGTPVKPQMRKSAQPSGH